MKLSVKLAIVLILSGILNILSYVLGVIPSPSNPIPTLTEILIMLTPAITCVTAGILAGSNAKQEFWLVLIPAVMNLAVWVLGTSVSGGLSGGIILVLFLGLLPGAIALGITAKIAGKKNA